MDFHCYRAIYRNAFANCFTMLPSQIQKSIWMPPKWFYYNRYAIQRSDVENLCQQSFYFPMIFYFFIFFAGHCLLSRWLPWLYYCCHFIWTFIYDIFVYFLPLFFLSILYFIMILIVMLLLCGFRFVLCSFARVLCKNRNGKNIMRKMSKEGYNQLSSFEALIMMVLTQRTLSLSQDLSRFIALLQITWFSKQQKIGSKLKNHENFKHV